MSERPPLPAAFLADAGLNRQHVFDLAALPDDVLATLGDAAGFRQLLLVGHGGRRLWERVRTANIGGRHPIDDYTVRTLARWFSECVPGRHYRILYPGPAPVGLQRLGTLAGWHNASPFMVGVDAVWGSWFAYRAALLADTDFRPSPPVDHTSPCLGCTAKPCIAGCPAGALADAKLALERCVAWRRQADSPCAFTCLARLACPAGAEHRYDEAQMRHSYGISLAMLEGR